MGIYVSIFSAVSLLKTETRPRLLHSSRLDIMESILENSVESGRKTDLPYRCDLNLSQFNLYAKYLIGAGLLKVSKPKEDGVEIFEITEKGKEFLRDYKYLKSSLFGGTEFE